MPKGSRTHSSSDRLPQERRQLLTRMGCDNEWPDDFTGPREGNPRYDDMLDYCRQKGYRVSASAVGRFGMRMRTLSRMKTAGLITREVMADLTDEKASQNQKAVAEMITATMIEFVADNEAFNAKEIRDIAKAVKDCTAVSISSDKYVREQLTRKLQKADASTKTKLTEAGVERKLIQEIIDEHLGVVKS